MRITADPALFGDRSEMTTEEFQALISGDLSSFVPPTSVDAVPDWQTNEKAFMARVVKYAIEQGWNDPKPYHTFDSASSEPGFPDLVMARGCRVEIAELKVEGKKPTKQQERWLDRFRAVRDAARAAGFDGIGVRVWWPEDWSEIERILG